MSNASRPAKLSNKFCGMDVVEVCRYNNGKDNPLVAVKRLRAGSGLEIEDLINEAKILRKMEHPCAPN